MLQLKRYKYNVYTGQFYKVTDPVTLPALVDMDSYSCEECEAPASVCGTSLGCGGKENVCSHEPVVAAKGTAGDYRRCGEVRGGFGEREGREEERWDREKGGKHSYSLVLIQPHLNTYLLVHQCVLLHAHCVTSMEKCVPHSQAMYRLMSVVSHKGDTSSGHYISDVYSIKEGSWHSCNDSSTTKVRCS